MSGTNQLVTTLKINAKQFDDGLKKSQKEIGNYNKTTQDLAKQAGQGFMSMGMKMAGGLGLAIGAFETFEKTIKTNQTTADAWDNTINTAKDTVQTFLTSIATGDFSAFRDGLLGVAKAAWEVSAALDSIGDAKKALKLNELITNAELTDLEAIIRDNTVSLGEREGALAEYIEKATKQGEKKLDIAQKNFDAFIKKSENIIGAKGITQDDAMAYLRFYNDDFENEDIKAMWDGVSKYEKEYKKALKKLQNNKVHDDEWYKQQRNLQTPERWFEKQYPNSTYTANQLINFSKLYNQADSGRDELYKAAEELVAAQQYTADFTKKTVRLQNTLNTKIETAGKILEKEQAKPKEGSLAHIDEQIKEYQKQLNEATDLAIRLGAQNAIDNLNKEKKKIQLEIEFSTPKFLDSGKIPQLTQYGEKKVNQKVAEGIQSGSINTDVLRKAGAPTQAIEANYGYVDSLNAISNALNVVNQGFEKNAQGYITYVGALATSVGTAVEAINKVTQARQLEAAANAKAAATGAAASVAGIPIVGALMAVGAIASVIAALSSIPKFANGGVVGGNSFVGDKIPAMVNSGEMILNKNQQNNLFNLLNSNNENKMNAGNAEVEFKIKGSELVGVLTNYNKKMSRI